MKKNLYISIVALSIAMFTSCKKEEMFAPQAPEGSSSAKTVTNVSTAPNTEDDDSNGIIVGSDANEKTGSGTSKPSRITVGSDAGDKTGSGTSRGGKKNLKSRTSNTDTSGEGNTTTTGVQK